MIVACGQDKQDGTSAADSDVQPADVISGLDQGLALINRDGIEAHLKYLADDALMGRMTGTAEYDEAAAYVAGHFAAIGLEQAGDDGWYQAVPMLARRIDVDSAKVVFHQDGEENEQTWKEGFVMGGDTVRAETNITAEVVFVGFGIHAFHI